MKRAGKDKEIERAYLLSEYGRQKLLGYADSFQEIAKSLNEEFTLEQGEESRQSRLYLRRLWENRCMLAENLQEMAGVMAQVAGEVFAYRPFTERKGRQVMQGLFNEGIMADDLYYIENREGHTKISLTLWAERTGGISAEETADMLSVLLDIRLVPSLSCPRYVDGSLKSFTFVEETQFVVLTGAARAVKETEVKSGDNFTIIESERGKITMLLSDGMGSGEKACEDSETVLDLMEKLTEAGYRPSAAANLVNSALMAKGEEQNMSTLDICEMDMYDGVCEFTKIGAAPSFIKRGYMVEQISAGTLPLGILKGAADTCLRRRLMDGDYVFLLSDGITDALEECEYGEDLCEIISNLRKENPREIAETLLQIVLRKTKGRIRDDMTVLVFGVWENK